MRSVKNNINPNWKHLSNFWNYFSQRKETKISTLKNWPPESLEENSPSFLKAIKTEAEIVFKEGIEAFRDRNSISDWIFEETKD